ncbi:MAG: hypothetical protein DWH91_13970 [Planctomycetota bacterium]|nr:MAG: hypothetical protein DWH91_13970 [Planctomycetota bacterium]
MHIGLRIVQVKGLFFDRQAIQSAVSRTERKVLSRFGAFVRQDAKQRIQRRKRASRAGESPTNRTGLLKRHIYFLFDPERRSVVIGPARLNRSTDAPRTLEHGGEITRAEPWTPGLRTASQSSSTVEIKPRPYMGPAFEKEQSQLSSLWKDSIR